MTTPICNLDDFYFTELSVKWVEPESTATVDGLSSGFDYDVFRAREDNKRYMLRLRCSFQEKTESDRSVGFNVQVGLDGLLSFPDELSEEDREKIVRYNGVALLYGVLRGQIASMTGSFPNGKLNLPTIMPQDIVNMVEGKKSEQTKGKKKPAKKSAKKKAAKKVGAK